MLHIAHYVVSSCFWTPIPKFHVLRNVASFLGCKAVENLGCYPKINNNTNNFLTFLKPATGEDVFFDFFKAKNKVKLKKIYFDLVKIKNRFAHFWKIKKNNKQFFLNFLFVDCFLMY